MDTETTDRLLRETLREAVEAQARGAVPAPFAAITRRAGRVRRHRRAGVGLVIVAVGAISVGLLLTRDQSPHRDLDTVGPTQATVEVSVAGDSGVEALPAAPLEVRGDATVAWTGSELVVWGGDVEASNMGLPGDDRSYADGAAYDPMARTWRVMSPSPLSSSFADARAAAVDAGVVIVRGTATALWNPGGDTWRQLDDAPAVVSDLVSTGDGALSYSANARLDLGTGSWTRLPDPPAELEGPTMAWTGSELVVVGGPGSPFTRATAIVYDPATDSWRTAAPGPEDLTATALAADWDGERIVVVNYDMRAATYDPASDSWSDLPDVPARFFEFRPSLQSGRGTSVAFMARAVALLTPDDRWIPLPYGVALSGATASTDSGVLFVWGLDSEADRNVLAVIDPAAVAANPPAVQVGSASVAVPEGYRFTDASHDVEAVNSEVISVHLAAQDAACTVTSSYQGMDGPGLDQPVPETLQNDGAATAWAHSDDERVWQTAATLSDRLEITCDDPRIARKLAGTASFPGSTG